MNIIQLIVIDCSFFNYFKQVLEIINLNRISDMIFLRAKLLIKVHSK